jgi:hypothetical protein
MRYKITAFADVPVLAYIRKYPPNYQGRIEKPIETLQWLALFANKPADGLGMIIGVDPRFLEDKPAVSQRGFTYVPITGTGEDYFTEHFGLFKIERSALPD